MSQPRAHHYCPAFYLAGFTEGGTHDSPLWTFDREKKMIRKSKARNEAHQRDFYRADVKPGEDPFLLEKEFGKIESEASSQIEHVARTLSLPNARGLEYLLSFAALLAVRTPPTRKKLSGFYEKVAKTILRISLGTKKNFKATIARLRREGRNDLDGVNFEEAKEFIDKDQYEVVTPQNELLKNTLSAASSITECLYARNWVIVVAEEGSHFICSDNPVGIAWTDPPKGAYRSPGFGLKGTEVTLPLTKKIGLVGIFERARHAVGSLDRIGVAGFNNNSVMRSQRFLYASTNDFAWLREGREISNAEDYFRIHPFD